MKQRIIAICMALVLALSLVGCGGSAGKELTLAENNSTQFSIVYPVGADNELLSAVTYLQEALADITGASFEAVEDMAVSDSAENCEILLGPTDRAESAAAINALSGAGQWTVTTSGNKVTLSCTLNAGIVEAAQALADELAASGDFVLKAGFRLEGGLGIIGELPVLEDGTLQTSCDCGDGAYMMVYEAEESAYGGYLTALQDAGYKKYDENTIGDNLFATYTKDDTQVQVMYLPAMGQVRIIGEENNAMPGDGGTTGSGTPSITMIGLEGYNTSGTPNQLGMSFVYKLSDGRFLVIDGGHAKGAALIYDQLTALSGGGDIEIAAWILTHAHSDHQGAFIRFAKDYSIPVEQFICNLPSDYDMDHGSETSSENRSKLYAAAKQLGAKIVKVHPGQRFAVGDAEIEILCTPELVLPQSLEYFNNSSLVFTVTLGGQKVMQLGDCGPLESPILTELYGDELKSDIVQIGHHGYQGATVELYQAIDPTWALWPGGSNAYSKYQTRDYNAWVLNSPNVKQTWVAEDKVVTFSLPIN